MGLLDIFTKKKEEEKKLGKRPKTDVKKEKKAGKKPAVVSIEKSEEEKSRKGKKEVKKEKPLRSVKPIQKPQAGIKKGKEKVSDLAYRTLDFPHISEKATNLSEQSQYVFRVKARANKIEVKKAIKEVYGTDVASVRIINVKRKKRRLGRQTGWKKGYKKVVVKLKEGQKIELLSR
jgi:large subunit ribosomal protein L23